jgi:hypothetical protein
MVSERLNGVRSLVIRKTCYFPPKLDSTWKTRSHPSMKEKTYKLAHLDRQKLLVAARKTVIAADAHYYAWTAQEQERFRVTMGEDAGRRIQCVLLDDLLDIKCRTDEVDEVWSGVLLTDLNQLNWARLSDDGRW